VTTDAQVGTAAPTGEEAVWRLATALAGSVTPFDVAEALAQQGGAAAEGSFANMAVVEKDSGRVRVVHHSALATGWKTYALTADVPACDAIRSGLPVLLATSAEIRRRYPHLDAEMRAADLSARAAVPVRSAGGTTLGAVGFGWPTPQAFTAPQLRRIDLIAQLTGLALERATAHGPHPGPNGRLAQALETMPNGFVSVDGAFHVTAVNAEGERVLGTARDKLEGRSFFDVFPQAAGTAFDLECHRAMETGQPVVLEEYYPVLGGWYEVRAWPDGNGLNIYLSNIDDRRNSERQRLVALNEAQQANAQLSLLATLSSGLAGVGTQSEIFERCSCAVVESLADWCTIIVPAGDELVRIAAAHRDPVLDGLAKRLVGTYPHHFSGPSPGVVVYRTATQLRLDHLAQDIIAGLDDSLASAAYGRTLQILGDGPGLITPIISQEQVVAVLTVVRGGGPPFNDRDATFMSDLARSVSAFLDEARQTETQREIATALQDAALPKALPTFDGVELAAGYRAATEGIELGGDWYDAFELQTGRIALVVGDVAGHGVQVAAVMAQMRNTLRAHLFAPFGLSESLSRLSRLLAKQEPDAFATIICSELDPATGELTWASAGHPAPILVSTDGTSAHLRGRPAPPIGWMHTKSGEAQIEHRLILKPGDRLLLFTDGLVERRGVDLAIGLTHLMIQAEQTRGAAGAEACEEILRETLAASHEDDVCLLIADFKPK
jgi:PAS domain S-box-containing protein